MQLYIYRKSKSKQAGGQKRLFIKKGFANGIDLPVGNLASRVSAACIET